ncbi:SIS domain-containing protein [Herbiconiux sp. VKM Ac-2851]|uniref:SIS domain-containing protein n=1 Tax=Herbiconiux sp. VKM Ac-2851 TaxID=2739025 RepID=UPI001566BEE5|nr:SIS domain-containing protein [Herbiconiux sp. VKM Ac-2851]
MDPARFADDLSAIPGALRQLADALSSGLPGLERARTLLAPPRLRVLVLGMGSSAYAAAVVAREARSLGRDVVVELASTALLPPPAADLVVVAVSATGGSAEVLHAVERYRGAGRLIAVTNVEDSALAARADLVVPLVAGVEASGVSCRTFRHTLVVLAALLRPAVPVGHASTVAAGVPALLGVRDPAALARAAAASAEELLGSAASWIDDADRLLGGPDGTFLLAPVERLSSAQQSALMLREVPRRPAWASETGDWSHVDVYLSKTLDYRALLFAGSVWDAPALEWLGSRAATVVLVGAAPPTPVAELQVRYQGDDDPAVALLVEPLVAELLAARWHRADPDFDWSRSLS